MCVVVLAVPTAHDRISTKVSWTAEIGPLIERRCVACHTEGGFAFPLTTYDQARPWAVAIKEVTLAGEMPPWGAAPGIGHFANDRRLTRHELELIAAWVDGGAPRDVPPPAPITPAAEGDVALRPPDVEAPQSRASEDLRVAEPTEERGPREPPGDEGSADEGIETFVPLANAVISEATQRTASVTLEVPPGFSLIAWTFDPGEPSLVERVDLELGTRWLGTWTPGESAIEFPGNAAAALGPSALFTARISYRAPTERVVDYSGLRIWTTKEPRPRTIREATVVRSWRATTTVEILALRPNEAELVEVVARFADGRVEPLGVLEEPVKVPHPTYRLARPLALPAGARVETTGPVRLLYTEGATRTVKPNVRRRPRR
jgi:hypothetical protein